MIQCTCQKDIAKLILADTNSSYKSQKIFIYIQTYHRLYSDSVNYWGTQGQVINQQK